MVKLILCFIIISNFTSIAYSNNDWQQIQCADVEKATKSTDILAKYEISSGKINDKCFFSIISNRNKQDKVSYTFYPSGKILLNAYYPSLVNSNKNSHQETIKSYRLDVPEERSVQLFKNTNTNELKLITASGSEIFFDQNSNDINTEKTNDFDINIRPIKAYQNFITVTPKKDLLITYDTRFGNTNTNDPKANILLEKGNESCRIPAKNIMNFHMKCYENCECIKKEGNRCIIDTKIIAKNKIEQKFIDGSIPKFQDKSQQYKLIQKYCPKIGTQLLAEIQTTKEQSPKIPSPSTKSESTEVTTDLPTIDTQIDNEIEMTNFDNNINDKLRELDKKIQKKSEQNFKSFEAKQNQRREKILANYNKYKEKYKLPQNDTEIPKASNKVIDTPNNNTVQKPEINSKINQPNEKANNKLEYCQSLLEKYFSDEKNSKKVNEYIKIQGKITLHRLAWNFANINKTPKLDVEANIKDLLQKRNPDLHKSFIEKSYPTRNQFLLEMLSDLKSESDKNIKQEQKPYSLKYSDTKMLHLLIAAEKKFGRGAKDGIMDFVSIIRNGLKNREIDENKKHIKTMISKLSKKKLSFEDELTEYLNENECFFNEDLIQCHARPKEKFSLSEHLSTNHKIIDLIYEKEFQKEEELQNNFKWGTYWLHVK